MSLYWLGGVGNICSNYLSPYLSIVRILFCQIISFQILLNPLFPQFHWSSLLPFPSYFNFHNLTYLEIDVSTHDMTTPTHPALNDHILNLRNTQAITKNISRQPINQPYPTHHPQSYTTSPHPRH